MPENYLKIIVDKESIVNEANFWEIIESGPFEGSLEQDSFIEIYISSHAENCEYWLQELKNSVVSLSVETFENKNWNEIWEKSFQPVEINNLVIRSTFHPARKDKQEIIIEPRMAFGTGHHATTALMCELMEEIDFKNKKVLDLGTGTGILAFWARKLGSRDIVAVDNDPVAIENSCHNARLNSMEDITFIISDKPDHLEGIWDVVLANIHKNFLLQYGAIIFEKLIRGGYLLTSGFYENDFTEIYEIYKKSGFQTLKTKVKNQWMCVLWQKK
jgi:ribosomal protein L11 methyltransferase